MRAAWAALAALVVLTPAALAAAPKPKPPGGPLRSTLYKMPAPLRANSPAWVGSLGKLAFLANQNPGEAPAVLMWDPKLRQMGRASEGMGIHHSLVAATDGRLAYVEQDGSQALSPPAGCSPGQDRIVVYDFQKGSKKPVFEGGNVTPDTLCWSHDGSRLAFLTADLNGAPALALLESGKGLAVTRLPVNYTLQGLIGFVDEHEVIASAIAPTGGSVLLRVGSRGLNAMPAATGAKVSPDGRYLLTRVADGYSVGVMLRGAAGGGRALHRTATGYGWGPGNRPFVAAGNDVVELDLDGRVIKVYPGAGPAAQDDIAVSPDGRFAALLSSHVLTVLAL